MAGAIAGRLEPFDPGVESIVVYLQRVELYFAANEIKAEKRVPVLLNVIGENYALLWSIVYISKETCRTACQRAHGCLEGLFQAEESGDGGEVPFSPTPAAWGVYGHVLGRTMEIGSAM